jgi:phosphonate ABC transporter permease subunit PhnE
MNNKPRSSLWRSVRLGLLIIVAILVYAYGFQKVGVNFEEAQSESRQAQLVRVLRALADPDIFIYDTDSQSASTLMLVPCSDVAFTAPARVDNQPYVQMLDRCGAQKQDVRAEGFGFPANTEGVIRLYPPNGAPERLIGSFKTDGDGHFLATFRLPTIDDATEPVRIEATAQWNVGTPRLSDNALLTLDKIVETIFLALIATTLGAILAVPISFLASRNIMQSIVTPFGGLMAALLAAPIGAFAGAWTFTQLAAQGVAWSKEPAGGALILVVCLAGLWLTLTLSGMTRPTDDPLRWRRTRRTIGELVLLLLGCVTLGLIAGLGRQLGASLQTALGPNWGFLGNFLFVIGDVLNILLPAVGAVVGLIVFSSLFRSVFEWLMRRAGLVVARVLTFVLGGLSAAVIVGLILAAIAWLRVIEEASFVTTPALVVGGIVAVATLFYPVDRTVPIGISIYYITRTLFNVTRAVEPLIYVIIFAIWVGIGPFAGTMALTLHTIAALGKLYSEQVENILPGPIEAITATGANRLQTIIYAVIPQITSPFISFTLYRWDVNVRMSTILGFAGGGGIGFVLLQNINLLRYRSASTMILAIAIVVAVLDYASSRIRERYV